MAAHRALPGRITPQAVWDATPRTETLRPATPHTPPPEPSEEIRVKLVGNTGAVEFRGIRFGSAAPPPATESASWTPERP